MGHEQRSGVADHYGLARVDRERRWTSIVNGVLVLAVVGWVVTLTLTSLAPVVRWGVTVVLAAMVVHRLALLAEHLRGRRRHRSGALAPVDQVASSSYGGRSP